MRFDPVDRLAGELAPPPDKSISHRAAIMGAMSDGRVRVRGYLRSADTAATLAAVAALGARLVDAQPRGRGLDLELVGAGLRGADPGAAAIDVGNAGTLLRILPGWLAGQPRGRWTLRRRREHRRRPVDRVAHPLRRMGATVDCREGGLPPIVVEGVGPARDRIRAAGRERAGEVVRAAGRPARRRGDDGGRAAADAATTPR